METKLKPKEKLFCLYYCQTRSPRLAAASAGYGVFAKRAALKLLRRTEIRSEIEKTDACLPVTESEVVCGYRRLAFGSAADAFRLLYSGDDLPADALEKLELMNVSEIKKPKGGGLEIKFFDRLKALEKLEAFTSQKENALLPFYEAIEKSAAASGEDPDAQ